MKKLINAMIMPLAALIDESRHINEDGSWDAYWAKKNCRAELRTLKTQYKTNKTAIRNNSLVPLLCKPCEIILQRA